MGYKKAPSISHQFKQEEIISEKEWLNMFRKRHRILVGEKMYKEYQKKMS